MDPIDEVRCQRDEWKVKAIKAEREVDRLKMLLGYAQEAIYEEYRLRVGVTVSEGQK